MKHFFVFLFVACFFSCSGSSELWVDYTDFSEKEESFLSAALDIPALEKSGFRIIDKPGPKTITISFERRFLTWEESDNQMQDFLPFSRTCMVFPAEIWDNNDISYKTNSSGDLSLSGLIPLYDLVPPYIACKINGFDISAPLYPLVYEEGIRFYYDKTIHTDENIALIREIIEEKIQKTRNAGKNNDPEKKDFFLEQRPSLFRIAAGGDVMLARGVEDIFLYEGPAGILGGTAVLVKESDLALINLEGTITGTGEEARKTYTFRFDPRSASALKNAGFDAILLANNHAFDYGMDGFLDTLDSLEKAGLAVLGAGRNIGKAAMPFVTANNGLPVKVFGLASYGRERSGWDGLAFAADEQKPGILHAGRHGEELIKQQLDKNDLNIIFYHGGIEYADYPDTSTRNLYTELVRSGTDLVIGSHPHVEQGFEWIEGKPVFWSLGDYVFDEMSDTPGGDKGLFIVLSYSGKILVHIDLYPVFMDGPRTVIMPPEHLERFYRLTKSLAEK